MLGVRNNKKRAETSGVLGKTFAILTCFRFNPKGMTLGEISKSAQINKSTAHRLLAQLVTEGFLERADDGRYVVGYALFQLAMLAPWPLELRTAAYPVMSALARDTGETVNLSILDRAEILVVHVVESVHEFRMAARVGGRRPFHVTAMGKALAAFLTENKLKLLLGSVQLPLEPHTAKSMRDLRHLKAELALTRSRGYSLDDEEAVLGVRAVAAPVFAATGETEAALSISGPTSRIPTERIRLLASSVIEAANAITTRLGGNPDIARLTIRREHDQDQTQDEAVHRSPVLS